MKILLAINGSDYSREAVRELTQRPWPPHSTVRILFVCEPFPYNPLLDPGLSGKAVDFDKINRERASVLADSAAARIRAAEPDLYVEVEVLQGWPGKMIVEEAQRWQADLILLGSHGERPLHRFLAGSVAQAVVLHAPCSVEVVRQKRIA